MSDHLHGLKYHTRYNSFLISSHNSVAKLQCKRFPHSREYGPKEGLLVIKDELDLDASVPPAEFRLEALQLDHLLMSIRKRFKNLPLEEQMKIVTEWESLRKTLESLPRLRSTLENLKISDLPKQVERESREPPVLEELLDGPGISGVFEPAEVEEGDIEEVQVSMDVCVYTERKRGRPWVGRVNSIDSDKKTFTIHWYERVHRSNAFKAMFVNNAPYVEELSLDVVMCWAFSEDREDDSFAISNFWLHTLKLEYEKLDK